MDLLRNRAALCLVPPLMIIRKQVGMDTLIGKANHHDTTQRQKKDNTMITIDIDIGKGNHEEAIPTNATPRPSPTPS